MVTLRSGLAVGLVAQVALLAALATTVGLTGFGWLVGIVCGVVMVASVDRGMVRTGTDTFGPADLVTLIRATLACAVAALVADSFLGQAAVTALVTLAAAGLVLDAVDGWVARRTRTTSAFGARFDGEVDAFLILVLSVYVAGSAGGWVLAIGAMRYAFAVAGWGMPWLRRKLPPRYWRKVVAATQGIVLTVAAADVVPHALMTALLVVALALLVESFGRDVWWSWRHRDLERVGSNERAEQVEQAERSERTPRIGPRGRAVAGVVLNGLALLLVWFALVVPDQAQKVTPGAFFRIPVEGLVVAGLALVLPALARRAMTLLVGLLLGLVALLKVLDMGFFAALDRPFNLVTDRSYFSPVRVLVRDAIGPVAGDIVLATAVVLALAILVFMPLSLGRHAALVARPRTRSLPTHKGLAGRRVTSAAVGQQTQGGPMTGGGGAGGLLESSSPGAEITALLQSDADSYTWVAAAVGSNTAAGYQLATEEPVMAIGGFNGSDPSPTLAEFEQYVANGEIHYFIGGGGLGQSMGGSNSSSEIASWVADNFTATTVDGITVYDLSTGASS